MIASLAMVAIMAGCAAYLYTKGTLAQGVAMIFNALLAGFVAFGFYELLSQYLIKYSPGVAVWAHLICFLLLFVLAFALLQAAVMQISKEKIDFGKLPEQIGRPLAGLILGYIVTGHLLVAAAMAPLPPAYPYARFDERSPNAANPSRPLLSPDGFVAGLFGTVSKGSFSALKDGQSFGVFHAGYVDQLFLNRHKATQGVPLMTSVAALDVPPKNGVWYAPTNLRDAENKPVSAPAGTSVMLVRAGIRRGALKDASKFTLSQVRLVCVLKTGAADPLVGKGEAVYPIGYIGAGGRMERKPLGEIITVEDPGGQGNAVMMDLAFCVPTGLTPVLLEFKRNNVAKVSAPAAAEDAPQPIPFGASAAPAPQEGPPAADQSAESAPRRPRSSEKQKQRQKRGLSDISRSVVGGAGDEN
jgi:hypothetical protein